MNKDYRETLCWNCKHAVPNEVYGCSWSMFGEPVEGWQATKTTIKEKGEKAIESYCVCKCPRFKRG